MPSPDPLRDVAWHASTVGRVLAGDVDAYGELVALYRPRCLRYARRMLGDQDEAEDITQETFVRAFRSLAQCDQPGYFGAWLTRILVNRCRTALEKRARWDRLVARDGSAALAHVQSVEPEQWRSGEIEGPSLAQVEAALQLLSTEQREAFVLKYVEDMSYDDMVKLTGIGVSALKMRVSRARDILRSRLLEVCDGRERS